MKTFLETIELSDLKTIDIQMMNPLKLAFLGDAIYEAYIRTYIITKHVMTPHEMSKEAVKYVKASAQARAVMSMQEKLSEEEWGMVKRGRNQKTSSVPKNANLSDYRYATGFESLIGYLYLMGRKERLYEIVDQVIQFIDSQEKIC